MAYEPTLTAFSDYPAGVRGFLYFGTLPGFDSLPTSWDGRKIDPTWGTTIDDPGTFSRMTLSSSALALPCENVSFTAGNEDFYESTGDAVPPTRRVKAKPIGGLAFDSSFPLVLGGTMLSTYATLAGFLKREGKKMYFSTSLQPVYNAAMYPCLLENFNIKVDGTSGASPVQCSMKTSGIQHSILISLPTHSAASDTNIVSGTGGHLTLRDENFSKTLHAAALPTGGRLANIKDCLISYGADAALQVVAMELNISQSLLFRNTADNNKDGFAPSQPFTANHIYIKERKVTGSFTMLSSSITNGGIVSDITKQDRKGNLLYEGNTQSAVPLYMDFGGLSFDMPAVYMKQTRLEMPATKSSLYVFDFLATVRTTGPSDYGWSEFK